MYDVLLYIYMCLFIYGLFGRGVSCCWLGYWVVILRILLIGSI